jgi:hypothetical protein
MAESETSRVRRRVQAPVPVRQLPLARTLEPVSPLALGLAQKPEVPARTAP